MMIIIIYTGAFVTIIITLVTGSCGLRCIANEPAVTRAHRELKGCIECMHFYIIVYAVILYNIM